MIYITSDHAGLNLKKFLTDNMIKSGLEVKDLGPDKFDPDDDYPDFVKILAEKMELSEKDILGIVICKNGAGVSIAANRFKYIRAVLSWNANHAKSSREDDNSNVLALPAGYISNEEALSITMEWIKTPFSNEERHIRRLNKLNNLG